MKSQKRFMRSQCHVSYFVNELIVFFLNLVCFCGPSSRVRQGISLISKAKFMSRWRCCCTSQSTTAKLCTQRLPLTPPPAPGPSEPRLRHELSLVPVPSRQLQHPGPLRFLRRSLFGHSEVLRHRFDLQEAREFQWTTPGGIKAVFSSSSINGSFSRTVVCRGLFSIGLATGNNLWRHHLKWRWRCRWKTSKLRFRFPN